MAITNADGSIILKTQVDESGAKKGFTNLKNGASKVGKALGTMGVAGASAVAMITKSAVDGYAEYEQLAGGVETLFSGTKKSFAEVYDEMKSQGATIDEIHAKWKEYQQGVITVTDNAANAYKTAGMSANEYMSTVTSFSASLIQSLGGDTAKAAEYADMAITDMSDNANKMGTDMELIQNAYNGFAKQNYTMLDNLKLGYGGTKEEMQRLLDDAEKLSGLEFDISSYADVVDAIHVVQTEMGITGTTAKEASSTIEGSLGMTKAAWQNLLVGMADEEADFEGLIGNLVESVSAFAGNLVPRIEIALGGVADLIKGLAPKIAEALPSLVENIIPMALDAVLSVVNALAETFPTLLVTLVQTIVDILPDLIPQLITGLVNMLVLLMTNFDQIILPIIDALPLIIESLITALFANLPQIVAGLTSVIKSLVTSLPQILASLKNEISTFFVSMWNGIKSIFANLGTWFQGKFADAWKRIKAVFSNVKQFFTSVWGNIKKVFNNTGKAIADAISKAVRSAINRVLSTATKIINGFIRGINVAIGVINAIPGVSIRKLSQISVPKLAKGAVLPPNKPFLAMVGDQKHGTNIEAPLDTIKQGVAEVLADMKYSNNSNSTIVVPVVVNGREILRVVREAENDVGKQVVFGGFANAY